MFDTGRERLRLPEGRDEVVNITLEKGIVKRPLKVLAFHSRDVYPQLLRSTLLVRLVAVYEAFLVDTIEEISWRSDEPFASDSRIDITQRQLLALDRERSVKRFIVDRTTRSLTSGGLEEIRKFYKKSLGFDIIAPSQSIATVTEIHDRRHLYVHRGGYADDQYLHRYPAMGAKLEEIVAVDEGYLLKAMHELHVSALSIKSAVEQRYPQIPAWKYKYGSLKISEELEQLVCVTVRCANASIVEKLTNLDAAILEGLVLKDIVRWVATDGRCVRWIVGGSAAATTLLFRNLHKLEQSGKISQMETFKIKRGDPKRQSFL